MYIQTYKAVFLALNSTIWKLNFKLLKALSFIAYIVNTHGKKF